jgi:hypothetical protein
MVDRHGGHAGDGEDGQNSGFTFDVGCRGECGRVTKLSRTSCTRWRLGRDGGGAWRRSNGLRAGGLLCCAAGMRGSKVKGEEWSRVSGARLRLARASWGLWGATHTPSPATGLHEVTVA